VFQADNPAAMIQSIRKVVHEKFTGAEAFEFYTDLSSH
ncbi:MAG: 3-hydroxy-5-phosphonooxypentane-2,4-dione thiolase LsrF, partial [Firmicutes bacterium HGW-Firmicutes-6]